MTEQKKRGKGNRNTDFGMYDIYKFYRTRSKDPVNKIVFRAVVNDLNKLIKDRILYESETFKLPYNLGKLRIKKYEHVLSRYPKKEWPINWPESRKLGFKVYFDDGFGYKWKWNKTKNKVRFLRAYYFMACRSRKREIKIAKKVYKRDYFL